MTDVEMCVSRLSFILLRLQTLLRSLPRPSVPPVLIEPSLDSHEKGRGEAVVRGQVGGKSRGAFE